LDGLRDAGGIAATIMGGVPWLGMSESSALFSGHWLARANAAAGKQKSPEGRGFFDKAGSIT
jgi:hypothetical protein